MKNISKKILVKTLQHNFLQLEAQAYNNVLLQDAQFKQSDFKTITLIICKQITFGERKGEIWKVTVAVDRRIANQLNGQPFRTISLEPVGNTTQAQKSYQYNPATKSISYLAKHNDAEGLVVITDKSVIKDIVLLAELVLKGDMLDSLDYIEQPKLPRFFNITNVLKISPAGSHL